MRSYLDEYTKKELIDLVHGLCDVISGRVYSHEQVKKRLKLK